MCCWGSMKKILFIIWYKLVAMPFRLLPIRNNRIFVSNYYGRGFGDNCKYIVDELNKHGNYDIRWLTKDGEKKDFPKNVKSVRHGTLSELFYLSTAHIWIDNSHENRSAYRRERSNTIYRHGIAL